MQDTCYCHCVCIDPRQSPQCVLCVLVVYEKFAENPEFRAGNFTVNLKHEISHAKLKCHVLNRRLKGAGLKQTSCLTFFVRKRIF